MNYLDLVNRLKRESARSGGQIGSISVATGEDLRLVDWISDAWLELQRRPHKWSFMRVDFADGLTVVDQLQYAAGELSASATSFGEWMPPASPGYKVYAGLGTNKWPLKFIPWNHFRSEFIIKEHAAAAPRFWSISPDEKLCIGPKPDSIYSIEASYYRASLVMSVDADVPVGLPVDFRLILVWRALMEVASFDSAPEVWARANKNFEDIDFDLRSKFGPKIDMANMSL